MSSFALIVLCCLALLVGQSYGQSPEINRAIQWAGEEVATVELIAREKFPPTTAAQNEVSELISTLQLAVFHCNTELKASTNIMQHEACVETVTTAAKLSLGELAAKHWAIYGASSGASRIHLFW